MPHTYTLILTWRDISEMRCVPFSLRPFLITMMLSSEPRGTELLPPLRHGGFRERIVPSAVSVGEVSPEETQITRYSG